MSLSLLHSLSPRALEVSWFGIGSLLQTPKLLLLQLNLVGVPFAGQNLVVALLRAAAGGVGGWVVQVVVEAHFGSFHLL